MDRGSNLIDISCDSTLNSETFKRLDEIGTI